jgi:hypothetical protein
MDLYTKQILAEINYARRTAIRWPVYSPKFSLSNWWFVCITRIISSSAWKYSRLIRRKFLMPESAILFYRLPSVWWDMYWINWSKLWFDWWNCSTEAYQLKCLPKANSIDASRSICKLEHSLRLYSSKFKWIRLWILCDGSAS